MARGITWGTPGRSEHYVRPRPPFRYVSPALLLGLMVMVALLLPHAVGWRTPVSPGELSGGHVLMEARCNECHAPRGLGVVSPRCQRCHDPGGAGRLTNAAHVLFGSGDPRKAAQAADVACARCHVEHRGAQARLASVDPVHCFACHFRSYSAHPEFAVLRSSSVETPGVKFGHERHVKEVMKRAGVGAGSTCVQCHEPMAAARDFDAIAFDRHCASCHAKEGSVGTVDPIRQDDVLSPEAILALGVKGAWLQRPEEFDLSRGRIAKPVVRHRDEWVLYNLRKLRREVDPEGWAAERGALLARISQLRRRLALASPLAGLDPDALRARESSLESEIRGVERRLEAQTRAGHPSGGLARLEEILATTAVVGDAAARKEALELRVESEALRKAGFPPAALPREEFEARRRELLSALDATESADPSLKPRTEDLRRRVLALEPGDDGSAILGRVRDQRKAELDRVRDEIALRGSGGLTPPPAMTMTARQREIRRAIDEAQARVQALSEGPPPRPDLTPEERDRKRQALEVLTAACAKCHVVANSRMAPVTAARRVLVRSAFVHQPHLLQADCARCHTGIEKSAKSQDLNFRGVESCRECHRPRAARNDCQLCHRYHPPGLP